MRVKGAVLLALFGAAAASVVVEPASKINFAEKEGSLSLAGVGVRAKKIVGPVAVKVYAVGFYVDPKSAASRLSSFKGLSAPTKMLYDTVETENFDKLIVLKMARKVGATTLINALAESLKPRMAAGSLSALDEFQNILLKGLKGDAVEAGKQFGFNIHNGKTLSVSINGKKQGEIQSPTLSKALLNTYLGEKAVSTDARKSIGEGLLRLVNK